MSYQDAKYATSFVTTLPVSLYYAYRVQGLYAAGYFDGPDGMMLAGRAILILIGAVVAINILAQIMLAIFTVIVGSEMETREDERDKLIELKAMNLAFTLFSIGFLASFVALAFGRPAFEVFHGIIFSMVLCGLIADLIRIRLHRRGF